MLVLAGIAAGEEKRQDIRRLSNNAVRRNRSETFSSLVRTRCWFSPLLLLGGAILEMSS